MVALRARLRSTRSDWRTQAALVLVALVLALVAAGKQATPANAVGEGVFQLDKTEYFTPEGTAVLITVQRADGAVLTQDVKVILQVDGVTEFDIPSAEATKLITFPAGTNFTSRSVFIQTLNKEQFIDRQIQVTILSVDNGGLIGARSTAPITLLGTGTPRVHGVSPDSGGSFANEGTILTVTGDNFIVTGATITSAVSSVQFWLPFATTAHATVTGADIEVLSPTMLRVRVPPTPTVATALVDFAGPASQAEATYDVRVEVLTSAATTAISAKNVNDQYVHTSGPTVTSLSVRQGPPTGGTQILVVGTKFFGAPNTTCPLSTVQFGGINVLTCQFQTPASILVTSPPHVSGPVHVIFNNGADGSPAVPDALFTYQGAPVITGLNPSFGPQTGGNTVVISGSNFIMGGFGPTSVLFGGNAAPFIVINDNRITATAPSGSGVQQVRIVHPVSGTSDFRTEANYTYSSGPLINSLTPAHGPSTGGSVVTITGTGFVPGAIVKFGDVVSFSVVISATQIQATSPPGAGIVNVSVNVNGTLSLPGAQTQFSYDGPTVTSIAPIAGPLAGGTQITIRGTNFTTTSVVTVGGVVTPAVFVDPTTLTTATPPSPTPTAAHVRVTTGSGQSPEVAEDLFTYTNGPIVDSLNPNNGLTLGATIVVVTGKNFIAPLSVSFGPNVATSFNVNSATQITVLSPPNGTAGPVDVRVTRGADVSPVGAATKFTYVSATPKITALAPNSGSTFGGTEITLTGLGFTGAVCPGAVKFGAVLAATCTVINDTTMTTVAPPNVSGPTVVVVQTVNGTSDIVANYTYISPGGPGGGTAPPAPGTGAATTYTLSARWTLLTWIGPSGVLVSDAIRGTGVTGGTDLSGRISAIYLWDPATASFKAYFTGAELVPGANDFSQFTQGSVYWVAILGTGQVPWVAKGP